MQAVGVLGAGPHGKEVAFVVGARSVLFDDALPGYPPLSACDIPFVVGAAWPKMRRAIVAKIDDLAWAWHDGVVVFPGAQVSPHATLGAHTHVLHNAVVSHGCHVGAFCLISAGAVLAGEVTVEDDVVIGANAVIRHGGIRIGRGATIAAGAVVICNVPAESTVMGVPARARIG